MANTHQNLSIASRNSSRHRPASFLGSYLESVEMDPDLMIGAAAVGHFQPVQWEDPNIEAHDFGFVEDDDGEGERLLLRRIPGRMGRASVDDEDGGSNVAVFDRRHSREVEIGQKRRWSTRLSETLFGFGKKVKERAGSFAWRRDSVQLQVDARAHIHNDRSSEAVVGSGESSRDGGDELSSVDLPPQAGRRQSASFEARIRMEPARVEYLYPVDFQDHLGNSIRAGEGSSAMPGGRMSFQSAQIANYRQAQLSHEEQEKMALLEREVRIAERQGVFSAARRSRMFRKAWAHRTTDEAQNRASVQYREELASRKKKSDAEFRRWSMSPLERTRDRVERWVRSVGVSREGSRADSADVSAIPSASEGGAESSREQAIVEESENERSRGNVAAARYTGYALQQSAPTVMYF
ncbi:hypothetical protein Q7P37_009304 [Cladosporium fusiforme]